MSQGAEERNWKFSVIRCLHYTQGVMLLFESKFRLVKYVYCILSGNHFFFLKYNWYTKREDKIESYKIPMKTIEGRKRGAKKKQRTNATNRQWLQIINMVDIPNNYCKFRSSRYTNQKDMESVLKKKKDPIVCCLQVIHFKYKDSKKQGWRLILKDSCEHACQGAYVRRWGL